MTWWFTGVWNILKRDIYPSVSACAVRLWFFSCVRRNPGSISHGLTWGENTRRTRYSVSCLPGAKGRLPVSRPMAVRRLWTSGTRENSWYSGRISKAQLNNDWVSTTGSGGKQCIGIYCGLLVGGCPPQPPVRTGAVAPVFLWNQNKCIGTNSWFLCENVLNQFLSLPII